MIFRMLKKSFFLSFSLIIGLLVLLSSSAFAAGGATVSTNTDVSGDGLGDLIVYDPSRGVFAVRDSSTGVTNAMSVSGTSVGDVPALGDFDGDGRGDLAVFNRSTGHWNIQITGGSGRFHAIGSIGDLPVPGDYDGDNCTDIATYNRSTGIWTISDCVGSSPVTQSIPLTEHGSIPVPGDYDCDGETDLATFYRKTSEWKVMRSSDSQVISFFCGLRGDVPMPADYNGDGCEQPAVHRPTDGNFYISSLPNTSGGFCDVSVVRQYGLLGDTPVTVNVDGDSAVDFAVFRPSSNTYYIQTSIGPSFVVPVANVIGSFSDSNVPVPVGGNIANRPVAPGDFNRDYSSDVAYVNTDRNAETTTWFFDLVNGRSFSRLISRPGDALVPGDYDGDGRSDPALVWVRPDALLEWHIMNVSQVVDVTFFGLNGDSPLSGDFDCDGKTDRVVTRNVNGFKNWYIQLSSGSTRNDYIFGLATDAHYAADITGDGCDELVVSRSLFGLVYWYYQSLDEGVDHMAQWGIDTDGLLTPSDIDADGDSDFLINRAVGNGMFHFSRLDGEGFFNPDTHASMFRQFGLVGDVALTGSFSGANSSDYAVIRPSLNMVFYRRPDGQAVAAGVPSPHKTLVRPDRSVVVDLQTTGGGGGGGGGVLNCDITSDFRDGANGALWKPVSESNGRPVFLLPSSYHGDSAEVFAADGSRVAGIDRTKCCPNGGRAHFWVDKTASTLDQYKPITVRIIHNGLNECRVVENPRDRID